MIEYRGVSVVLVAIVVAGCAPGDGYTREASDVTVSDSAGVQIVVSGAPPASGRLAVADQPEVSIGEFGDEDPNRQLHRVRGAVLLGDGTIVVANEGSHQLRFFDGSGNYLRSAGGPGGGPGEFSSMTWLGRTGGDTILVHDPMAGRLSRFAPSGAFVGEAVLDPSLQGARVFGQVEDGGLLLSSSSAVFSSADNPNGLTRAPVTLFRADAGGTVQDTLGVFPGTERVIVSAGSSESRTMVVMPPPFGRGSFVAAHDGAIAVAVNDTYEIRMLDVNGELRRLVRRSTGPVHVTAAHREAFVEARLASLPEGLRGPFRSTLEGLTYPETMPAFVAALFDDSGRLWVRESVQEGESQRWAIFDHDGALAAELRLPESFDLKSAGRDYVLGVMRDEFDIEQVQLLRVLRDGERGG